MFRELAASAILLAGFMHVSGADAFPRAYRLAGGTGIAAADASRVALEFAADGRVSGTSGCNRVAGTWRRNGETVVVSPLATTRMACADDLMNLEQAVLGALGSPGQLEGEALTFGEHGRVVLRFE